MEKLNCKLKKKRGGSADIGPEPESSAMKKAGEREVLLVSHVSKSFNGSPILTDFSASFQTGFNLLSGSSGAGKTTLLRIIAGLDGAYNGKITGVRGKTTFMFQEDRLFPWLTALENVCCTAPDPALANDEAKELLSELMISKSDQIKYPSELSGGMKRRVALARALLFSSHCGGNTVLMDEPFKGLDPDTMAKAAGLCMRCLSRKIVIVVSHEDADAALNFANVVYIT